MKYVSLTFVLFLLISCSNEKKRSEPKAVSGNSLFIKHCVLCHGADGKLSFNGAKDLSISTLKLDERIAQVTNGKNIMPSFKTVLSEEEIKAVANYTFKLKTAN